jgi:hypothetical protein
MNENNGGLQDGFAGSSQAHRPPDLEHQLRMLADKLEKRGLNARLAACVVDGVSAARYDTVTIANQAAPERGIIHVEDDGCVTWELPGSLDDAGIAKITREALNVLRPVGSAQREFAALISRISVTYVKPGLDGERDVRIIGLTSKVNRRHIQPDQLQDLLDRVALCCEDVLMHQKNASLSYRSTRDS